MLRPIADAGRFAAGDAATLWAGPKCHIVHYPLSGWKVFNLVVTYHNDAPEPVAGKPRDEVCSFLCMSAPRRSSVTARTGGCGCCATAIRSSAGSTAASRCSATPRIRCCNISRKRVPGDGGRGVPVAHAAHDDQRSAGSLRAQRFRDRMQRCPAHRRTSITARRMPRLRDAIMGAKTVGGVVRDLRCMARVDDARVSSRYIFINAWRSILPVPVFGSSSMNLISRGYL